MTTIKEFAAYWHKQKSISTPIFKGVAKMIYNSALLVMDGKHTVEELKQALQKAVNQSKNMTVCQYYERALNDLNNIVEPSETFFGWLQDGNRQKASVTIIKTI